MMTFPTEWKNKKKIQTTNQINLKVDHIELYDETGQPTTCLERL